MTPVGKITFQPVGKSSSWQKSPPASSQIYQLAKSLSNQLANLPVGKITSSQLANLPVGKITFQPVGKSTSWQNHLQSVGESTSWQNHLQSVGKSTGWQNHLPICWQIYQLAKVTSSQLVKSTSWQNHLPNSWQIHLVKKQLRLKMTNQQNLYLTAKFSIFLQTLLKKINKMY